MKQRRSVYWSKTLIESIKHEMRQEYLFLMSGPTPDKADKLGFSSFAEDLLWEALRKRKENP